MLLSLVMFPLRYCSPGLLLSWQLLRLLAQVTPIQEWAGKPVQLTPKPLGLTQLWSDLPSKSLHGAALSSDTKDFDYLGSSTPFQMVTLPQWTDSGDLPLEPDQFPVPRQDLRDKVTHPGKLPETVTKLNDIKNQDSNLPLQFKNIHFHGPKSKIQASGHDQATDHQAFETHVPPLERPSSKVTQLDSPLNLKKDLAQDGGLAKAVAGTPNQSVKAQLKKHAWQDGDDQSVNAAYSNSLPLRSQTSGGPPEPPEQVQPSQLQLETRTQTPPTPDMVQSLSPQQEGSGQLPQLLDETEAPMQQEAPAQHTLASEELVQPAFPEVSGPSPSSSEAQHSSLPPASATPTDIKATVTSEAGKEDQSPPSQQQAPVQSPESPEEVEQPSSQQELPSQPPELLEDLERSGGYLEVPGPPEAPSQEVKPPMEEADSALASESPVENVVETPPATVQAPSQDQYHLPNTTAKPANMEITITSEPTRETDSSLVQQEPPAQPPGPPLEAEPSLSQEQESTGQVESSGSLLESPDQSPEDAAAVDPDSENQLESSALPDGNLPVEPQAPVQTPESPVESKNDSPQYNMPSATVRPMDVALTIISETIPEGESSPAQQETPFQTPDSSVAESSPVQQEPTPSASEPPKEGDASTEQGIPGLPLDSTIEGQLSTAQQMTPSQPVELPENLEPSPVSQPSPAQPSEPPMKVEPAPTQQVVLPELPEPPPTLGQDQTHSLTSPRVTSQPVNLELTISSEPTKEAKHSTALTNTASTPVYPEVTPADQVQDQHTNLPEIILQPFDLGPPVTEGSNRGAEPSPTLQKTLTEPPQTHTELVTQAPVFNEFAVAMTGQDQTQLPVFPKVQVQPLDQIISVTPVSWIEAEWSETLATAIAPPPEKPEVTTQDQTQANTNYITIHILPVEHSRPPQAATVVQQSPSMKKTLAQPPEPPKKSAAQSSVPASGQVQAQSPVSPTTEAAHSQARVAIAPPPKPFKVTSTDQGQTQSKNPAETIALPLDVGTIPEYSEISKNDLAVLKDLTMTICKLCLCQNETLSCADLSPEQKLHQVPVPEPSSYNGTFTILNFQENKISYIDKSVWKEYPWTEKLILSDNQLTELHKDTFEGLLPLQHLDLHCNKIRYIERGTFDSLPFLKSINLACNVITELNFGTFQAWHGMQFLNNIDIGKTHVQLKTVENVLLMSLQLEELILPSQLACCLCQFKSTIEVMCNTVKLHCESGCLTNTTNCRLEGASIGNPEGPFRKALQFRKETTNIELTIESDRGHSFIKTGSFSDLSNDNIDESDVIDSLNYILRYFSQGNLEDVASVLLPFIKLLFSNVKNLNDTPDSVGNVIKSPRNSASKNSAYENNLNKLYLLERLIDTEIKEKIDEVKNMRQARLLGPKFKRQVVAGKLATSQGEANGLEEMEHEEKRRQRRNRAHKTAGSAQERPSKTGARGADPWSLSGPAGEESADAQRPLWSPASTELQPEPEPGWLEVVPKPQKSAENSFVPEPSLTREHEAAVSPSPAQFWIKPTSEKSQPDFLNKRKDLRDTFFVLEDASAMVRGMVDTKPVLESQKQHQDLRKKKSRLHQMVAKRPLASALRSLINSLPRGALSSSGDLSSLANPFPEISTLSDPSTESTTVENQAATSTFEESVKITIAPEEIVPENTNFENPYEEGSVISVTIIATDNQIDETPWKDGSMTTASSTTRQDLPVMLHLSAGDQFENELYDQMQPLVPDKNVRKLIAHIVRTLKMDCSQSYVQLPCARLMSRTSLLMKLLSEQQGFNMSKIDWDTEQWKSENYLSESTEAHSGPEGRRSTEIIKEVPGHGYNNKLILAITVTAVVTVLIIIFCLIEIYSHRAARKGKEGKSSGGCFLFQCRSNHAINKESQEGFYWLTWPLWLRDMHKPLHATRKRNMAKDLHDRDSSDEDEIFITNTGELSDVMIDSSQGLSSVGKSKEVMTE